MCSTFLSLFQNGSNLVESFLNIIRSYAETPGIFDFKKDQLPYILNLREKCEKMICRKLISKVQMFVQKIADLLRFHIPTYTSIFIYIDLIINIGKYIKKVVPPLSLIMKSLIAGLLFCCIYSTYFGI